MKGTHDKRSNLPQKLNQRSADHDDWDTGDGEERREASGLHVEVVSREKERDGSAGLTCKSTVMDGGWLRMNVAQGSSWLASVSMSKFWKG